MTKMNLSAAIDEVLGTLDESCLRSFLGRKTATIYYLATLKNRMSKKPSYVGICSQIESCALVRALSPTWKHFSGNPIYPVPGSKKNQDPEEAYERSYPLESRWTGQQKRYRFSLIDHLLKNAPAFYKAVEKRLNY